MKFSHCAHSVGSREGNKYMWVWEEISCTRNLLIYTLPDSKHGQGDENESCGFLCRSANKASAASSVM